MIKNITLIISVFNKVWASTSEDFQRVKRWENIRAFRETINLKNRKASLLNIRTD